MFNNNWRVSLDVEVFFMVVVVVVEVMVSHHVLLKKVFVTHFTNLNSLNIENNMLQQHSQKPFLLYTFSSKHVSAVWCQKKAFALHHFLKPMNCILEANVCIFLFILVQNFWFKRRNKTLFDGMWVWDRLNNLFKVAGCLDVVKSSTFFYHLHNDIFQPIQLFQLASILLYHFPYAKLH